MNVTKRIHYTWLLMRDVKKVGGRLYYIRILRELSSFTIHLTALMEHCSSNATSFLSENPRKISNLDWDYSNKKRKLMEHSIHLLIRLGFSKQDIDNQFDLNYGKDKE